MDQEQLEALAGAVRRHNIFLQMVPNLYSYLTEGKMEWPTRTVQLLPGLHRALDGLFTLHMLLGTQTGGEDPNRLMLFKLLTPPSPGAELRPEAVNARVRAQRQLQLVRAFRHPLGDVDRARCMPQRPALVAVKCEGAGLSLFDLTETLAGSGDSSSEEEGLEEAPPAATAAAAAADGEARTGGDDDDAMDTSDEGTESDSELQPRRLSPAIAAAAALDGAGPSGRSGGRARQQQSHGASSSEDGEDDGDEDAPGPCCTLQEAAQEGTSLSWSPTHEGRLVSGLAGAAVGCYALREGGSLARVSLHDGGHMAGREVSVSEVTCCAELGSTTFASCADDGRVVLWDWRQAAPAQLVCRGGVPMYGLAYSPRATQAHLLAAGGDNEEIRILDTRRAERPLRLLGHRCPVLQLEWSPHADWTLAAADTEGRVVVWDGSRVEPFADSHLMSQPKLLFAHAGHLTPVTDLAYSADVPGMVASVSTAMEVGEGDVEGLARRGVRAEALQGSVVQVWVPSDELVPLGPLAGGGAGAGAAKASGDAHQPVTVAV